MNISDAISYLFPGVTFGPMGQCFIDGDTNAIVRWNRPEPQPTPEQIAAAILPATKAQRIEQDRQECRRRLTEFYGDALEQVSRASGLYGATAQANHAAGVEASIDASNAARDTINTAATIEAVEAVTVSWPVLT